MKKLLVLSVLVVVFCFCFHNRLLLSQASKDAKVECKLILKAKKVKAGQDPSAEVEIRNTSKQDLTITYNTNLFEFLDMEVIDPTGKKVSEGRYGGRFSPFSPFPEQRITLRPGGIYRGKVDAFGSTKQGDRATPGVYKITATYEYNNEKAVSDHVQLTVTSD